MHVRKVTKAEDWTLQDLANSLVALLGIQSVLGISLADKKAEEEEEEEE